MGQEKIKDVVMEIGGIARIIAFVLYTFDLKKYNDALYPKLYFILNHFI